MVCNNYFFISDIDRLILSHLSQLKQQLTRLTESVNVALQCRVPSDSVGSSGLPQGLTLPLDSLAEIDELEIKLQQAAYMGQLVFVVVMNILTC